MRILLALLALLCGYSTTAGAQTLRPGDTISISIYQDPKLDRQVVIAPNGMISFPLAGQIRAGGLTTEGVEAALRDRLKDKFSGQLDITVAYLAKAPREPIEEDLKPRIFVTGEVIRPGYFVMRQRTTLMQAIALSGGLGPFAARGRIQVRRLTAGVETIYYFDYGAFEAGRDMTGNIDLRPGDVVMVPERGLLEF